MRIGMLLAATAASVAVSFGPAAVAAPQTTLVSGFEDLQADGGPAITTGLSCISGDGEVIGFYSEADNLATSDTNMFGDLFIVQRGSGQPERVNIGPGGAQANAAVDQGPGAFVLTNTACALTIDGSRIVYASRASNLVAADTTDSITDVFIYTLASGLNSKLTSGANNNSSSGVISGNGNFVVFVSSASNIDTRCNKGFRQVFLADISNFSSPQIRCISVNAGGGAGNGNTTTQPNVSADGRYVVFDSDSTNLVAGDSNDRADIFLYDRVANTLKRVSVSVSGDEAEGPSDRPVISSDGAIIAFVSAAPNLIAADTQPLNNFGFSPIDIFLYDRSAGQLLDTRVNLSSTGQQANVVEDSGISPGIDPSISADGRYIAFVSSSTNLVPNDNNGSRDVFVHDRILGLTAMISVTSSGAPGNSRSFRPAISGDGLFVVFDSIASNLLTGDSNGGFDVFLRGPLEIDGNFFSDDFEER